jgi:hypothetical protein
LLAVIQQKDGNSKKAPEYRKQILASVPPSWMMPAFLTDQLTQQADAYSKKPFPIVRHATTL